MSNYNTGIAIPNAAGALGQAGGNMPDPRKRTPFNGTSPDPTGGNINPPYVPPMGEVGGSMPPPRTEVGAGTAPPYVPPMPPAAPGGGTGTQIVPNTSVLNPGGTAGGTPFTPPRPAPPTPPTIPSVPSTPAPPSPPQPPPFQAPGRRKTTPQQAAQRRYLYGGY